MVLSPSRKFLRLRACEPPRRQSRSGCGCVQWIAQVRVLPCLDVESIGLDETGHDIRQRFIAWHGLQNFLARDRIRASPAAGVDRHGIHNLSVNSRLETAKTDIGGLMIAAARRAAGPVNRERIHAATHFVVESFGERHRTALGFDESEVAIIRPDASDQSTQKGRRARGKLFEQRFFQKFGYAMRRNIGNDGVLCDRETNLAVSVICSQACELVELFRVYPARWNAKPTRRKTRLFL